MGKPHDLMTKRYDDMTKILGYKNMGLLRNIRNQIDNRVFVAKEGDYDLSPAVRVKIRSKEEYDKVVASESLFKAVFTEKGERRLKEKYYRKAVIPGKCAMCGSKYGFSVSVNANQATNLREALECNGCSRMRRERIVFELVRELCAKGKNKIYLYETGRNLEFVNELSGKAIGSEYISSECKSGDVVDGVLHEDAHHLSFNDEEFDIAVSRDVFEHINNIKQCIGEMFRILRGGGTAIITIPWNPGTISNHQRAKFDEKNDVVYLDVPAYHWNPVTNKRDSLVFWDYGWEFLELLKEAGFSDAYVLGYRDARKGYMGDLGTVFIARK